MLSNQAIILTDFPGGAGLNFVKRYAAVYCEVTNTNITGSRQFATRVFPLPRVVSFLTRYIRIGYLTIHCGIPIYEIEPCPSWKIPLILHPISTFDVGWQPEILSPIARLPAGLYYSIRSAQNMRALSGDWF